MLCRNAWNESGEPVFIELSSSCFMLRLVGPAWITTNKLRLPGASRTMIRDSSLLGLTSSSGELKLKGICLLDEEETKRAGNQVSLGESHLAARLSFLGVDMVYEQETMLSRTAWTKCRDPGFL